MVQITKDVPAVPAKASVRGKPWKKSAKKGGATASKKVIVEEEKIDEVEEVIPKDISKVKRKRSKDAHQRRRELAKTKLKDKKKTESVIVAPDA